MTDLRTAAQQALEAIRIFREWEMGQDYHSSRDTVLARAFAAEETLEAALAEPVQEPVAWRITDGEGGWGYCTELPEDWSIQWSARYGRKYEPLYTAPPQRRPLTEEEIDKIADHLDATVIGWSTHDFARAIERAHGIKE